MMVLGQAFVVFQGGQKRKPYQVPRKERITEHTYQTSRWTPVVKDIIEDLIDNKLEERHFPFLGGRAAAGSRTTAPSRSASLF